ncbi:esterase-like activity of phytase family protein [Sphingobium nicotianae]|uniref:Esterase-like activity of phytase family protein n=1 Tax=Sphingobium nicotianae TaxID=2782607 RepID=A0A9X1DFE0_9SPHN|nr:esterase-like activity of phytase family protein [Sphingobium nicotianae]MBT2188975.1 esterase-like activity of phytase family protein [Sphingobium nicotianae]
MQRIALILMLFVLLMNGRHGGNAPPTTFDSLFVHARPLSIDEAGDLPAYGPLRLTHAWQLTSDHRAFGGISSMTVGDDGAIVGLNDTGELFGFRVTGTPGEGFVEPLPRIPSEQNWPSWKWDSESMQRDPASGRLWVGFELIQRICRYAPGFTAIEGCVSPPALRRWPLTGSIETLVRFGDGRFLAISEMGIGAAGAHDALLWQGDPVDPNTPPPVHLGYRPPTGYRPTDAVWLGGDKLLVLNRRLTLADGFTARLSLVTLPKLEKGAVLTGRIIATFAPPGLADNFEALALSHEQGKPVLWVASDDNHLFLQRTLLLRFALPPEWLSDKPAP